MRRLDVTSQVNQIEKGINAGGRGWNGAPARN